MLLSRVSGWRHENTYAVRNEWQINIDSKEIADSSLHKYAVSKVKSNTFVSVWFQYVQF